MGEKGKYQKTVFCPKTENDLCFKVNERVKWRFALNKKLSSMFRVIYSPVNGMRMLFCSNMPSDSEFKLYI